MITLKYVEDEKFFLYRNIYWIVVDVFFCCFYFELRRNYL